MKPYPIKMNHLDLEVFDTPNGYPPHITQDGWFGGDVVYEPKTEKVYRVCLVEVEDVSPEFIEKCKFEIRRKEITRKVNKFNVEAIEKIIDEQEQKSK